MTWPQKIAHGGEGTGRMPMDSYEKNRQDALARDGKRRFMQDAVLAFMSKTPNLPGEQAMEAFVDMADHLYQLIQKKVR